MTESVSLNTQLEKMSPEHTGECERRPQESSDGTVEDIRQEYAELQASPGTAVHEGGKEKGETANAEYNGLASSEQKSSGLQAETIEERQRIESDVKAPSDHLSPRSSQTVSDLQVEYQQLVRSDTEALPQQSVEGVTSENQGQVNDIERKQEIAKEIREDGKRREDEAREDIKLKYPEEEGYRVVEQAYLRDADGNIVKDNETGESRRADFVVVKDGKVVDVIEVTSETADKRGQMAKEDRIREQGGNYIKEPVTGELIQIPDSVRTTIDRRA